MGAADVAAAAVAVAAGVSSKRKGEIKQQAGRERGVCVLLSRTAAKQVWFFVTRERPLFYANSWVSIYVRS